MNNLFLGLKFVFSYFSILPVSFKKEDDLSKKEVLNYTLFFLPLVGFVLGLLTLALYSFLDSIPFLAAIISSCVYFVLYGFIHTEAVLDVSDAIYAKHSGKDAYKIIKEPTVGAIGVLYALIFVVLKISLFSYLLMNEHFLEFLSILVISRISIQFSVYFFTFRSSFVSLLCDSFTQKSFLVSIVLYSLLILFLTDFSFLLILVFAFLFTLLIVNFLKKALGFLNGDALGFILESLEIILAFVVAFIWL
ncbi:adenosylcobinamide-GDP ribazoletransferase [Halarcobacter ebronensis]|uniref:Adenosylcobinamide-GDP ribazoletransferase n=1 Tax=Halarcobacter ebronensis TaxID=1462615 RepID=A0A4Q0YJT6_9BACT|nr:adenosylcobinamide-GDP ribazoletransferase [Halarcobacter ebronensis]RXJ70144.1 adenosylcobinamide-GDP ribazoletransferase [Halarcobacter ebronensis]